MDVPSYIQLHTLPPLDQNQRMRSSQACTRAANIIYSGWEERMLMKRETGYGLTALLSTTQGGTTAKEQEGSRRTALLCTLIMSSGMIMNVLNHILIFVKSILITNKDMHALRWEQRPTIQPSIAYSGSPSHTTTFKSVGESD